MAVKSPEIDNLHRMCGSPEYVTNMLRSFRKRLGINTKEAGYLLGVPARTLEGVEQGREFLYPALLVKAILIMTPAEEGRDDAEV